MKTERRICVECGDPFVIDYGDFRQRKRKYCKRGKNLCRQRALRHRRIQAQNQGALALIGASAGQVPR